MFEMVDPGDGGWESFVPSVPPEAESDAGCDDDGCLDPMLELEAGLALAEFEQVCEAARLDELDADGLLAEAAASRLALNLAEVRQLVLAGRWADLHGVLSDVRPLPGGQRLVGLGGAGSPEVAEFAAAELGAVLRVGDGAAARLIGDALDLRHRFPLLWGRVQTGEVAVWPARRTVELSRGLSVEAAARVDAQVARLVGCLSWTRLRKVVTKAILEADPPEALSDAERAADEAGAAVTPDDDHGYLTMIIKAAAGDVQALDKVLDLLAAALKVLGDPRPVQQRRATAVGIIADPKAAQDLLGKAEQVRRLRREAAVARRAGDTAAAEAVEAGLPGPAGPGTPLPFVFNTAVLYYHLSRQTLDAILAGQPFAGAAVTRVEDIGPVVAELVRRWLQHSNVVLKPVIDLAGTPPVDHYETPTRVSETIGLRRQGDYFPYGSSLSRHQEDEHTIPYLPIDEGGPPGQTDPARMAKISRFHHRIKTFTGWSVDQLGPQHWCWRTPHGYRYLEGPNGTTPLGKL